MNIKKEYLTAQEAMILINISYPTMIRLIKQNRIPNVRVGSSIRIPLSFFNDLEKQAYKNFEGEC